MGCISAAIAKKKKAIIEETVTSRKIKQQNVLLKSIPAASYSAMALS